MDNILEWLVAALLLMGSSFALIGSFGLLKLPDFYTRLHAPTKAVTLGVGSLVLASVVYFGLQGQLGLHELLISVFLFMTAPTSASMMAKAAMQVQVKRLERTRGETWQQ